MTDVREENSQNASSDAIITINLIRDCMILCRAWPEWYTDKHTHTVHTHTHAENHSIVVGFFLDNVHTLSPAAQHKISKFL